MDRTGESYTELSVDEFLFVLESSEVSPSIIHARDTRTRELLSDMCEKTGIILSINEDTPKVEDFFADFMLSNFGYLLDPDWDDEDEEFEDEGETFLTNEEFLDHIRYMSDRDLTIMPENLLMYLKHLEKWEQLPKDLSIRMDRVLGKGWRKQEGYPE